jgi:hypothetical protein
MGTAPSSEFYRNYQAICSFLAEELSGIVQMWQIANELDVAPFAGPLTPRHACDFVLHAARGLKEVDSSLIVGTNFTGRIKSYYFYGRLYADPHHPLDYCGADGYYGTWKEGGPEQWVDRIDEIHDLTGVKVLVNEWGYASAGGLMSREERDTGLDACHFKKWPFAWGDGHTPEVQAEHVRATMEVFRSHRDKLLGAFFYRWEDQKKCWACGEPDCPAETAWGLTDREGKPKPAYYAFKESVQRLKSG